MTPVTSKGQMPHSFKTAILFLLNSKTVICGVAILLLMYVASREHQTEGFVGCWDCGWQTRQAFYLLIAASTLLLANWWASVISLLAGAKVLYSVGHLPFWNNMAEVHGVWRILKASLRWTSETHPEFFVEISLALVISSRAISLLGQHISRRHLSRACFALGSREPK
jgi:uncharacterized membrane protein YjjB (DUF3815 family)